MPVRSAVVNTVDQILDMDMNVDDIHTRPSRIRQWFTNNIIRRMLAYPLIFDGVHFKLQRSTPEGITLTAPVGGGLHTGPMWNGTTTNDQVEKTFYGVTGTALMIHIWTNDVKIQVSWDGVEYGTEIRLVADTIYMLDLKAYSFKIRSYLADNHATYEVVCFMIEPYVT